MGKQRFSIQRLAAGFWQQSYRTGGKRFRTSGSRGIRELDDEFVESKNRVCLGSNQGGQMGGSRRDWCLSRLDCDGPERRSNAEQSSRSVERNVHHSGPQRPAAGELFLCRAFGHLPVGICAANNTGWITEFTRWDQRSADQRRFARSQDESANGCKLCRWSRASIIGKSGGGCELFRFSQL